MPANPLLSANGATTPAAQVLSVSELNRMARELLESALPLMWVGGEISNLVRAASGHVYFTLKDASAQVRCAMWRNRAQLLAFRPENGMRVEARALVTLYEARGDYQLNVEALRPAGIGSLFAQRVLDLPPTWNASTLVIGALAGTAAAMLAGWLSMRRQFHATVRETLGSAAG